MIVRSEARVIRRALESARPHIDYWVICDTGSTDDTPEIIKDALQGVPGELHHTSWANFGHNRTEAIKLAKGKCDYILIMDADMVLNVKAPFKTKLVEDYYEIRYEGSLDYSQHMLVSDRYDWRYIGITHEYIYADDAKRWDFLPEVSLKHFGDGSCRSDKFERDIRLLAEGLKKEPGNVRYMFYLAQSYKDLGRWEEALHWYEKRATASGWEEERWYAMYQVAEMKSMLDHPWPEVQSAYLKAFDARTLRLEPIHALVKHYRRKEQFYQAYLFSSVALQGLTYPVTEKLFIDKPIYDYLLLFEFAIAALNCGRISESIEAANMLLRTEALPQGIYDSTVQARKLAYEMLWGNGNITNEQKNHIVIVTPFHNAGAFLDKCVRSLLQQDYQNFEVIFIDDASTDANRDFVPPDKLNARLIRNTKRKGAAFNLHHAITEYCSAEDIVVCLDGDDELACANALSTINRKYALHDCWVLYSRYHDNEGAGGISAPFASPKDFATVRSRWRCSHIKTFRAGLFHSIAEQDPEYQCLKDGEGNWLTSAVDAAIMFPLLEMAGFYRVYFHNEVLYIYNFNNPLSHHFNNLEEQIRNFEWVSAMRPFAKIAQYNPAHSLVMCGDALEPHAPLAY